MVSRIRILIAIECLLTGIRSDTACLGGTCEPSDAQEPLVLLQLGYLARKANSSHRSRGDNDPCGGPCVQCPAGFTECPHLSYDNLVPQPSPTEPPSNCLGGKCENHFCGTSGALALCVEPKNSSEYYIEQANLYFDYIDPYLRASAYGGLNYFTDVIRFEWPPWLLFTGFGAKMMKSVDLSNNYITPFSAPRDARDCKYYDVNPFVRCSVVLADLNLHAGTPNVHANSTGFVGCGIYEEFSFNAKGEIIFIEAWSATLPKAPRLSNRLPGLGSNSSSVDHELASAIAHSDPDVAYFESFFNPLLDYSDYAAAAEQLAFAGELAGRIKGGMATEMAIGCAYNPSNGQAIA